MQAISLFGLVWVGRIEKTNIVDDLVTLTYNEITLTKIIIMLALELNIFQMNKDINARIEEFKREFDSQTACLV